MINSFRGDFHFLSNFFPVPITIDGITYSNGEAAFQAQKTTDLEEREKFKNLEPAEAKKLGRKIALRPDWESIKDDIMYRVCRQKFVQYGTLKDALLATGEQELIEGNTWGDTYWGIDLRHGRGCNKLGKILMRLRQEFRANG